jgi:hypothetical protein
MYERIRALFERNEKAANTMVAEIVRGVHAGNPGETAQHAAKTALETAEEILTQLLPDPGTVTMDDEEDV